MSHPRDLDAGYQPADDPHNLVLIELMGLWTTRAERGYAVDEATATFRRAVLEALAVGVPQTTIAAALGVSRKTVQRHRDAGRLLDPDD